MVPPPDLIIDPPPARWPALAARGAEGDLLGTPVGEWRERTRGELGLPAGRPIIATGHQTLLWHPGILAKYMAVAAATRHGEAVPANLIVDQHADGFGSFPVPVALRGGGIAERLVHLTNERAGVPMALHEPFVPPAPPPQWSGALPSVDAGVGRIIESIAAHRDAPDSAHQMGFALADMMARWVEPMPNVTSTELIETCMGRHVLAAMVEDPWRCADAYNAAVARRPDVGIAPLLVRDDYVELPLWRIRNDGRRMRAYDSDVERWLEDPASAPRLMPRALALTALVRLALCDLFVHGTGGAAYDTVMEDWVQAWLGVTPAPIAVVSATLHLPLEDVATALPESGDERAARTAYRRAHHDPESLEGTAPPGPAKRALLETVGAAPYRSPARRSAFFAMHEALASMRESRAEPIRALHDAVAAAMRRSAEQPLIDRRTWPFPLYPEAMLDALNERIMGAFAAALA